MYGLTQLVTGKSFINSGKVDPRLITCRLGSENITFLIDSGATVNTITSQNWESLKKNCRTVLQDIILEPNNILKGYACKEPLELECSFKAFIGATRSPVITKLAQFFVVKGTQIPLLSYSTSIDLGLLCIKGDVYSHKNICPKCELFVNILELKDETDEMNEFPKIPMDPVKFRIAESIIPKQIIRYCIPKAFENQVHDRLQQMESKGIIERADGISSRITSVSPLVLVPKGESDFRIVVDYREVNKAIIREPYPMPSLEKIWTNMPTTSKEKFFTKLDLKDAQRDQ